ncbi:hypothetical protein ElyMa_000784000 [Elysia marginata]|uniref:Uncharacterized protein n=1 Tax=Elysia marginata TaxID=1093978 RepID=A0AAV4GUS0_9GAST|nr:hypothetical protein ElyMa_000784000 [Elysia marginata]
MPSRSVRKPDMPSLPCCQSNFQHPRPDQTGESTKEEKKWGRAKWKWNTTTTIVIRYSFGRLKPGRRGFSLGNMASQMAGLATGTGRERTLGAFGTKGNSVAEMWRRIGGLGYRIERL